MLERNHPLPRHQPLVVASRSDAVENVYFGSVAVCDAAGNLLWSLGDCEFPVFARSALKPLQALPFALDGGPRHFDFARDEIALTCASHAGEERHLAGVTAMLRKAGIEASQLQCGAHIPLCYAAEGTVPPSGFAPTALHHNCSGKHAGFLAWCRLRGEPLKTYLAPDHPLQRRIRSLVAAITGCRESDMRSGTDGCSAPTHALALRGLARAYARLACEREGELGAAFGMLFDAMTGAPEMVSGRDRTDAALMQSRPGDWLAKGGAEAVQAIGIRSQGIGIAIKMSDGDAAALRVATAAVLQRLTLLDQAHPLHHWTRSELRNAAGTHTGSLAALV
jgi:L-asparaginase II